MWKAIKSEGENSAIVITTHAMEEAEALINSGMVESLLKVIRLIGDQQDQIMFVTRAVRIVDLVTNVDMQCFQKLKGMFES